MTLKRQKHAVKSTSAQRKSIFARIFLFSTVLLLVSAMIFALSACDGKQTDLVDGPIFDGGGGEQDIPPSGDTEQGGETDPSGDTDPSGGTEQPDDGKSKLKRFENVCFSDATVEYDGRAHIIEPSGDIPFGTTITYSRDDCVNAGEYEISATFKLKGYETLTLSAKLTILPAKVNVIFEDGTYVWDGYPHSIYVRGDLPSNAEITYSGNEMTEVGTYVVTAHIELDTNYEPVGDLTATLTISERIYIVRFVHWDGSVEERRVPRGGSLTAEDIPENKPKDGYYEMIWDPDDLAELYDVREDKTVYEVTGMLKVYTVVLIPRTGILSLGNYSEIVDGEYVLYYTAESDITLDPPYSYDNVFEGWYDENGVRVTHLPDGELRDMRLTAHWRYPIKEEEEYDPAAPASQTNDSTYGASQTPRALTVPSFRKSFLSNLNV